MPGETARVNGLKGGRPILEATKYREALIREIEKHAKPLAEVLVKKGLEGDVPALKEINDRGLGKAPQSIVGADGVGPVQIVVQSYTVPPQDKAA